MHFMIDTETLSTAGDAALIQIGIQAFDPKGSGLDYQGALIQVDGQACINAGLRIDWETIRWWSRQSDEARASAFGEGGLLLSDALAELVRYGQDKGGWSFAWVWSNGAAFDIPILENAFRRCRRDIPWAYNRVLDVRTMKFLAPDVKRIEPEVAHDALSDAQAQALWVQKMYRALKGNSPLGLLWDKLSRHDWTYMMSDDPRVNREGAQKDKEMVAEARALGDEGAKLYDAWRASVWDGGEKPERPW